jgi:hypothetical protein
MSHRGARWGNDSAVGVECWHVRVDRMWLVLFCPSGMRPFG